MSASQNDRSSWRVEYAREDSWGVTFVKARSEFEARTLFMQVPAHAKAKITRVSRDAFKEFL